MWAAVGSEGKVKAVGVEVIEWQIHLDTLYLSYFCLYGGVAHMVEHSLCMRGARGSIPRISIFIFYFFIILFLLLFIFLFYYYPLVFL